MQHHYDQHNFISQNRSSRLSFDLAVRLSLIGIIFFFSGASGLIYQVVWARKLQLIFGSTVFATSAVLTTFMAGLALGSYLFGRIVDRLGRPLRLYAALECGIAIFALLSPFLLDLLKAVYILIYRTLSAEFYSLTLIRFILSFLVLLIPTTLMGGTLPVVSKFVVDQIEKRGRRVGLFYALNTFGAMVGTIATGFFLIRHLGVMQTIILGAVTNFVLAGLLFWLDLGWEFSSEAVMTAISDLQKSVANPPVTPTHDSSDQDHFATRLRTDRAGGGFFDWIKSKDVIPSSKGFANRKIFPFLPPIGLLAFAISGFCALGYEVLWTRMLVFFLGSTTYAFSTMLAAFLFGIAFGSLIFAWLADRNPPVEVEATSLTENSHGVEVLSSFTDQHSKLVFLGLIQVGIGLSSIALVPAFSQLFEITKTFQALSGTRLWTFVSCLIVMLIPTTLMGGCFPVVTRIYATTKDSLGQDIGRIYMVNTVGSILGALLAGFVLIPLIGIRRSIGLLAMLNVGIGCLLVLAIPNQRVTIGHTVRRGAAILGSVVSMVIAILTVGWSDTPLFLKSAIFKVQRPGDDLVDYREEIDASVTTLKDDEGVYRLYVDTNQAADASRWDSPSHRVIAHLPLLLHPNPKRALVVGFGMGVTSYSMTQHGVAVDAVEISKGVIDAARQYFTHVNHNVVQSPLFDLTLNDGRNYILMTPKKYDMISTGIIHPLVSAGSSNIYSEDFYRLCKRILTPNGIMCQWVPLHRVPELHYKMIIRTFLNVFPHTTVWYKYTPDFVILIGTPEKLRINFRDFMARTQIPSIQAGLRHDDLDGWSLLDSFIMGEEAARSYVGEGLVHTDNHPYLEFFGGREIVNTTYKNVSTMMPYREQVSSSLVNYGHTLEEKKQVRQTVGVYFSATQDLIRGHIAYAEGELTKAAELMNQAVMQNPRDMTLRYNLGVAIGLVRENAQAEFAQLEAEARLAVQQDNKDPQNYFQLAVSLEAQGRLTESAKIIEQALKLAPNRVDFYIFLGPLYERLEKYDQALRTYKRLEAVEVDLPAEIFAVMASLCRSHGKVDQAVAYAQKSKAADPNSWHANYVLAELYFDQAEYKKAQRAIDQAIIAMPDNLDLRDLRAEIQKKLQ